jgi:hypothetical protein
LLEGRRRFAKTDSPLSNATPGFSKLHGNGERMVGERTDTNKRRRVKFRRTRPAQLGW